MSNAFPLTLIVEQINRPNNVSDISTIVVSVTPEHTIHHIKELIWIYSENHSLKPVFLKIKYTDSDVNDLDTIGHIDHEFMDPASAKWKLVVDYTLFNSPFIPNKEPVPTEFVVQIAGSVGGQTLSVTLRRTLDNLIGGIKEEIHARFDLPTDEFDLISPHGSLEAIPPSQSLKQALALDVPPLQPITFTVVPTSKSELRVRSLRNCDILSLRLDGLPTFEDIKKQMAVKLGELPQSISLYRGMEVVSPADTTPDGRLLREVIESLVLDEYGCHLTFESTKKNEIFIDGEYWRRTGKSLTTLEDRFGNTMTIDEDEIPSDYYTIQWGSATVKLSTSDLILNEDDGYVLLSPRGFAKLQHEYPLVQGMTNNATILGSPGATLPPTRTVNEGILGGIATSVTNGTSSVLLPNSESAAHTPGEDTQTPQDEGNVESERNLEDPPNGNPEANAENGGHAPQAQLANELNVLGVADALVDPVIVQGEPHNIGAEQPVNPIQGNQTVIERFRRILVANVQNFVQFGVQAVIIVMVFGFEIFRSFLKPEILAFILVALGYAGLFLWGGTISEWLEHNILENAPANQVDFQLVREVARVFRFCTSVSDFVHDKVLNMIKLTLPLLFRPRHEWFVLEVRGRDNIFQKIGDYFNECVGTAIMFFATLLPSLQDGIEQYLLEVRNSEASNIWQATKTMLDEPETPLQRQQFALLVEAKFGSKIEEFADDYESLLGLYVATVQAKSEFRPGHSELLDIRESEGTRAEAAPPSEPPQSSHDELPVPHSEIIDADHAGATGSEVSDTDTQVTRR